MLDNIEQGLCIVDTSGVMEARRSHAFDTWFGPSEHGKKLVDHIGDETFADWFTLSIEILEEDVMPVDFGNLEPALPNSWTVDRLARDEGAHRGWRWTQCTCARNTRTRWRD